MQLKRLALVGSIMLSLITVGVLSTNCGKAAKDFGTVSGSLVNGSGGSGADALLAGAQVAKNNPNLAIQQTTYITTDLPAYDGSTTFIAYDANIANWFATFVIVGVDGTTTGSFTAIYCGATKLTTAGSVKFTGQYSVTDGVSTSFKTGTVTLNYTVPVSL